MKNSALDWLMTFFQKRKKPISFDSDIFDKGLIDSFGLIELVSEIEKEFHISLTSQHLQDRRFRTISGLSKIVNELKDELR